MYLPSLYLGGHGRIRAGPVASKRSLSWPANAGTDEWVPILPEWSSVVPERGAEWSGVVRNGPV